MTKGIKLLIIILSGLNLSLSAQRQQLVNTQSIGQKHPDSVLIVLKKTHAVAVERKDKVTEGICLQKMGQICYNQGHYAQALDFHQRADRYRD